jgi:hypothetical protein
VRQRTGEENTGGNEAMLETGHGDCSCDSTDSGAIHD